MVKKLKNKYGHRYNEIVESATVSKKTLTETQKYKTRGKGQKRCQVPFSLSNSVW